jgi:hypothetical protein
LNQNGGLNQNAVVRHTPFVIGGESPNVQLSKGWFAPDYNKWRMTKPPPPIPLGKIALLSITYELAQYEMA